MLCRISVLQSTRGAKWTYEITQLIVSRVRRWRQGEVRKLIKEAVQAVVYCKHGGALFVCCFVLKRSINTPKNPCDMHAYASTCTCISSPWPEAPVLPTRVDV